MSESASGAIADFITFSKRPSGQQVRWQKKQTDAQSAGQVEQREKFLTASVACRYFGYGLVSYGAFVFGSEKSQFDDEAVGQNLTGYNLCISEFLNL